MDKWNVFNRWMGLVRLYSQLGEWFLKENNYLNEL